MKILIRIIQFMLNEIVEIFSSVWIFLMGIGFYVILPILTFFCFSCSDYREKLEWIYRHFTFYFYCLCSFWDYQIYSGIFEFYFRIFFE